MNDAIVGCDVSSDDIGFVIHAIRVEVDRDVFTVKGCSCQTVSKIS